MVLILSLMAVVAVGFVSASTYFYRNPMNTKEVMTVVIPPRTGTREVLSLLHAQGVVPAPPFLWLPVYFSGANRKLKAGEYAFEPGMSPAQVIGKIARGEIVVHKLTVPEGWTSYQVRMALAAEPLLSGELPATIEEGSVFPDTVHFTRNEPRAAVLARMQRAREEVLAQLWADRAEGLPYRTPEEALVMASVVEKETGVVDERGMVAGVFVNRLRLGMPLQSDPTVAYGIARADGGKPMSRALTTADLKADTVYNTYTRTGLPPAPICNPGRDAIHAALHPSPTNALYFVATGHGGHYFAPSLKEHTENVSLYRKAIR